MMHLNWALAPSLGRGRRNADGSAGENGHKATAARQEETIASGETGREGRACKVAHSPCRAFIPFFVSHRIGTGLATPWQGHGREAGQAARGSG